MRDMVGSSGITWDIGLQIALIIVFTRLSVGKLRRFTEG